MPEDERAQVRFPRSPERGPIEAVRSRQPAMLPTYFRALLSAAPLKQPQPRVHPQQDQRHFRALLSAAPLKPPSFLSRVAMSALFPRSPERGPIEADLESLFIGTYTNFRALLSAAPLKHGRAVRQVDHLMLFPRSPERGPIEAFRRLPRWRSGPYFRALLSAAPLKLDALHDQQRAQPISALS